MPSSWETAESDDNTVNKRALQDGTLNLATGGGGIEFRLLDRVRSQMTQLYRLLRENGRLNIFSAVGRPPPSCINVSSPPEGPLYLASGSKIIPPTLLEEITNMEMINLTPRPTNLLLYGSVALALLEGLASLFWHKFQSNCSLFHPAGSFGPNPGGWSDLWDSVANGTARNDKSDYETRDQPLPLFIYTWVSRWRSGIEQMGGVEQRSFWQESQSLALCTLFGLANNVGHFLDDLIWPSLVLCIFSYLHLFIGCLP